LLEDFLYNIGVSFEDFCDEMTGGWMFGYIDALRLAGVRTILFCVSARVSAPARFRHRATGATICVLPAPRVYRALRRRVLNPYAATVEEASGAVRGWERIRCAALKEFAPYLSTPLLHLRRELRRERCDALLCQDYEHGRFEACLAVARTLAQRLPVFATFQGGDCSHSRLESLLRRVAVRSSGGLIIASASEAARVESCYGSARGKIARIFNPLDLTMWAEASAETVADGRRVLRQELGISETARVVVWHGRVDFRRKGLDVLLEAWQRICQELMPGRDLRLLLIGTGNNAALLRERIAEMKPRGLVWIDEYLNDRALIRRYLCAADVYAFPSRHEGFPVAPLEAMACGLPLVAADAPGVPDILEGGEAAGGLVVPRGDADAFARALARVLDDAPFGRKLGARARARVDGAFSHLRVGEQLRAFLFGEDKSCVRRRQK